MSHLFKNLFGLTYVEAKKDTIIIGGIPTSKLLADINKIWGSVRVVSLMFNIIKKNSVEFDNFFAIDILYMLQQISLFKKRVSSRYRIHTAIDLLKSETWLRRMNIKYPSIVNLNNLKQLYHQPLPHQQSFFEIYSQKTQQMGLKGFLLGAGVGSGKSWLSLALSVCIEAEVVMLLAPKSLANNVWRDALLEEFGPDVSYWASTEDKPLAAGYKYYIFHYDALNRMMMLYNYVKNKRSMIVLDESHNFNNESSIRSSRLVEFCRRVDCHHVVFSSGTAVKLTGNETITLLQCIDPLFNANVEQRFKKIYGVSAKRANDILRHRLDLLAHKIPLEAYMTKVPKPIIQRHKIKIPDWKLYTVDAIKNEMRTYMIDRAKFYIANMKKYTDKYNECISIYKQTIKTSQERDAFNKYIEGIAEIRKGYDPVAHKAILKYCNEFEKRKIAPSLKTPTQRKDFKEAKSVYKYMQLKVLGEALGRVLARRQAECHCKMIEHGNLIDIVLNADKKTLCFTSYVEVVEAADAYFKSHGLKPTLVYGGNKTDVGTTITAFKKDPTINPIIATMQSMSAGVTIVNCSVCIFLNSAQRSYMTEQASARIYRIGQDCQTYIVECVLDSGTVPNISEKTYDIMEFSRQCVEEILGKGVSEKEMSGIVQRLQMNPETKLEKIIHIFADLFR